MLLMAGTLGFAAETAPEKKAVAKAKAPVKYRYNSLLGMGLAKGSSVIVGGQLGFPINEDGSAFAGPELDFALYSPGSLYALLGTFWYDFRLDRSTKSALSLGGAAGMVSTDRLTAFPSLTYAAFLDFAVSSQVDEDVYIRGQLRPGIIGNYFALWMSMNVTFLFR